MLLHSKPCLRRPFAPHLDHKAQLRFRLRRHSQLPAQPRFFLRLRLFPLSTRLVLCRWPRHRFDPLELLMESRRQHRLIQLLRQPHGHVQMVGFFRSWRRCRKRLASLILLIATLSFSPKLWLEKTSRIIVPSEFLSAHGDAECIIYGVTAIQHFLITRWPMATPNRSFVPPFVSVDDVQCAESSTGCVEVGKQKNKVRSRRKSSIYSERPSLPASREIIRSRTVGFLFVLRFFRAINEFVSNPRHYSLLAWPHRILCPLHFLFNWQENRQKNSTLSDAEKE